MMGLNLAVNILSVHLYLYAFEFIHFIALNFLLIRVKIKHDQFLGVVFYIFRKGKKRDYDTRCNINLEYCMHIISAP